MPRQLALQKINHLIHKTINPKEPGSLTVVTLNSLEERLREKGEIHPKDKEIWIRGEASFSIVNLEYL